MDARDFLRANAKPNAVGTLLKKRMQAHKASYTPSAAAAAAEGETRHSPVEVHMLMNLPEFAIDFLGGSLNSQSFLSVY